MPDQDNTSRPRPAMQPVKSGMLTEVGYDPESETLHVQFTNGGRYAYHGVSPAQASDLLAAESVGKFFAANIRGTHAHTRIDSEPEDRSHD